MMRLGVSSLIRTLELSGLAARAYSEIISGQATRVPTLEEARQGLRFADAYEDPQQRRATDQLMLELFGRQSIAHNVRGQAQLFTSVLGAAWDYIQLLGENKATLQDGFLQRSRIGLQNAYDEYQKSLSAEKPADIDPQFVPMARRAYLMCLIKWAKVHGLNVEAVGRENIPGPSEPVIYLPYPHSSLMADFLISLFDPQMSPVADSHNYFGNEVARKSGFSWLSSRYGQPLINRRNPKERIHFERLLQAVQNYGLRPGIFPHTGRVLMAYDDQGRQERAGFYSAIIVDYIKDEQTGEEKEVIDTENYARYGGLRLIAGQMRNKLKQPVKVVPLVIKGAEMAMPATTGDAPFIGPDRFGERVSFEFLPARELIKGNKKEVEALVPQVEQAVRQALGIDAFLENRVAEWARYYGRDVDLVVQQYRHLSLGAEERGDPEWSIVPRIADLVRTIHPAFREREFSSRGEIISQFLSALETGNREKLRELRDRAVDSAYRAKYFMPQ